MKPHLLIAVDAFNAKQLATITNAVEGWATWERIAEKTPPETYLAKLANTDLLVGWPRPQWLLSTPVKLCLLPSAGYDSYLNKGLEQRPDLIICNARGAYSPGVAEHCIGLMMALARRIPGYLEAQRSKTWLRNLGHDRIEGATACIVGLGDIGKEVARRCAGLGMRVTGVRSKSYPPDGVVEKIYGTSQLAEAVSQADHVISTLPGGPATEKLFDAEIFDAMRPGAYFYNVGRGSVVDEKELIKKLQNGQLAGAGLDVFEEEPLPPGSPLWKVKNLLITPHVGGYNRDYVDNRLSELVATNLKNYHEGKPLVNVIELEALSD